MPHQYSTQVKLSFLILSVGLLAIESAKATGLFQYPEHPIPLKCIATLVEAKEDNNCIEIGKCLAEESHLKPNIDGWYELENSAHDITEEGYFNYKFLVQQENTFFISFRQNSGGSGIFTGILPLQLDKDKLCVVNPAIVTFGDRCNGGVNSSYEKDGMIYYSINMTPPDILAQAKAVKVNIKPYADLEASARSCFADANYVYKPGEAYPQLVSINFLEKISDQSDWTENYKYQSCFNKVYNQFIDQGISKLDAQGIEAFAQAFKQQCIDKT
jgi:hypothetical protein